MCGVRPSTGGVEFVNQTANREVCKKKIIKGVDRRVTIQSHEHVTVMRVSSAGPDESGN